MYKESLLPMPTSGRRRTKVLRSKSDRAQLQGAVLKTGEEDAWDHFVQIKLWTQGLGWSIILKDPRHNTVVDVGPYWREEEAWKATREVLASKGYDID